MAAKKRGLGRGLGSLIPSEVRAAEEGSELLDVPIGREVTDAGVTCTSAR